MHPQHEHSATITDNLRVVRCAVDVLDFVEHKSPSLISQEAEDDKLLNLVEKVLAHSPRKSIVTALELDIPFGTHEFPAGEDEVCYVLASPGCKTYYMCTNPPEDNDNLICEQQADGMDYVCQLIDDGENHWDA